MILNKSALAAFCLLASCIVNGAEISVSLPQCPDLDNTVESRRNHLQCLDQALEGLHRDLTAWQNKNRMQLEHIKKTTGNAQLLPIFNRAEEFYAKYVESQCRWRYLKEIPDTTKAAIRYKQCEYRLFSLHLSSLQLMD